MKKILVLGGTGIDAKMGKRLVRQYFPEYEIIDYGISKTPEEQTLFQTAKTSEKKAEIFRVLDEFLSDEVVLILVYCNSLSASLSFDDISSERKIPILTPMMIYKSLGKQYSRIGLMAANAQGASGIEKVFVRENSNIVITTITNIEWVVAVEEGMAPEDIIQRYGLPESREFFRKTEAEAIIIGCTHFPYFLEEYQADVQIPCVNIDPLLVEKMKEILL
ncbi:MAG: aspartate/glutamate racemase family protein [Streptococcaceae bacterium]|jgi:glutamate racemase|nr:aspartate/glutamate racemase family protein [Streptococcaceae bacterium]